MQLSVTTFLGTVERSGLVEKSQLASSLSELERCSGPDAANDSLIVSEHLGRVGLITEWQRKLLLEGRHNGFFLGKYRLLDHLGTGGMSSVYLAEHPLMRRRVAIKVLPKNRVNDSSYLARFHREARAVASLDHPNIVRAFDVDNEGDIHYLVMEYVEGHDLKAVVDRDGPLAYRTAADYMRQAADGLAHAHEAGLVHRDVKPANLLIDAKQVVKLLDMGLARTSDEIDASLTKDHDERMLGTVDYLAPEQALDSHLVDPRADIYSLGCTLYFALTGHPPFPDGTLAQRVLRHQTKEPQEIAVARPDVPASLVAICRRMTAKSPSARYQNAVELSQALADWIGRFDRGETRVAKSGPDEELQLAPLDDEPPRGRVAPAARPASPTPGVSESVKSDTTKVDRVAAGKTTVSQSGPSQSGKLPVAKPIGSSIKGPAKTQAAGLPSADSPAGKSSLERTGNTPGSSIKGSGMKGAGGKSSVVGREVPKKPGSSIVGREAPKKSGSSIKGLPAQAGGLSQPQRAVSAAQTAAPQSKAAPAQPQVDLSAPEPLLGPLSGGGLLDDLLSDPLLAGGPPLAETPVLLGKPGGALAHPLASKPATVSNRPGKRTRWDSTWFLIFVGTLLGLTLVTLFVACRLLK
ncbi:MAG TPA: protein kinase [Pirellulales bacterium]|jgi:serine/threonine-protein kinase|nr:protein kinase [Pirellulales bacterium]